MKKSLLLAFCSLLIPLGAPGVRAQQAPLVVATCGTQSLTPGTSSREYIDATGNLCSSATGGGGGGGAITAAAGSYAAGAFSVGAGTDGWNVTQGIKSQAACATDIAACSLLERLSRIAVNLTTLNTTAGSPLAPQSASVPIGGNALCDGANGSTNPCTTAATVLASATTPAVANKPLVAALSPVSLSQGASAPINVSTATTTQIVALSGSTKIFVTSYDVVAGGTGNITFVYGTGSNCGTGTTSLTGAYNMTAQAGIAKGSGAGTILFVPAGNALCVTTTASVQMSGSVSYLQF